MMRSRAPMREKSIKKKTRESPASFLIRLDDKGFQTKTRQGRLLRSARSPDLSREARYKGPERFAR